MEVSVASEFAVIVDPYGEKTRVASLAVEAAAQVSRSAITQLLDQGLSQRDVSTLRGD